MSRSSDVVGVGDLVRGVIATVPEVASVNRGLFNLLRFGPDDIGSIGLRLQQLAEQHPHRIALRFEGRDWSYADLNAWSNRVASVLRTRGVRPGRRVAIMMENRAEVLPCMLAVTKLGAVACMINVQQRGEVLAHSLKLTEAGHAIVGAECSDAVSQLLAQDSGLEHLQVLWEGEGQRPARWEDLRSLGAGAPADNPPEVERIRMRQPCFYIFTSGTTGLPKASVMTHYRWLRGMAGLGQMSLRLRGDDVLYCCLPLYHNNALTVSLGAVFGAGATFALGRKFSASRFWDEVRASDATSFCYIGELCRYLLNRPDDPRDRDHRVRVIVGNGLRPEIWDAFRERFGIGRVCEFYGASESNLAFANGFGLERTAGFCPLPFAIVEFDVLDEQPVRDRKGHLRRVSRGGTGLLITEVTDKAPFEGYTDARATEAKLLRDVFKRGDVWFNTGDLVRDQGFRHIQFVDRIGDTFRWKGENVATTEVEAALNRFDGIEHAVVYGVQVPQADGRAGMAAVSFAEAPTPERLQALAAHLRAVLPAYAVPVFLRLRQEHEVTGTFKFRKGELKQQGFDPEQVDEPLYWLADPDHGYAPLGRAQFDKIAAGGIRL